MMHVLVALAGGPNTTGVAGVNAYLPCDASTSEITNVSPAHAVPACPTPVAPGTITPGSTAAGGQSAPTIAWVPQLGTNVIDVSVTFRFASGPFDWLVIVNVAGTPDWPTVNGDGRLGTTPKPTPAHADDADPNSTEHATRNPSRTPTRRGNGQAALATAAFPSVPIIRVLSLCPLWRFFGRAVALIPAAAVPPDVRPQRVYTHAQPGSNRCTGAPRLGRRGSEDGLDSRRRATTTGGTDGNGTPGPTAGRDRACGPRVPRPRRQPPAAAGVPDGGHAPGIRRRALGRASPPRPPGWRTPGSGRSSFSSSGWPSTGRSPACRSRASATCSSATERPARPSAPGSGRRCAPTAPSTSPSSTSPETRRRHAVDLRAGGPRRVRHGAARGPGRPSDRAPGMRIVPGNAPDEDRRDHRAGVARAGGARADGRGGDGRRAAELLARDPRGARRHRAPGARRGRPRRAPGGDPPGSARARSCGSARCATASPSCESANLVTFDATRPPGRRPADVGLLGGDGRRPRPRRRPLPG